MTARGAGAGSPGTGASWAGNAQHGRECPSTAEAGHGAPGIPWAGAPPSPFPHRPRAPRGWCRSSGRSPGAAAASPSSGSGPSCPRAPRCCLGISWISSWSGDSCRGRTVWGLFRGCCTGTERATTSPGPGQRRSSLASIPAQLSRTCCTPRLWINLGDAPDPRHWVQPGGQRKFPLCWGKGMKFLAGAEGNRGRIFPTRGWVHSSLREVRPFPGSHCPPPTPAASFSSLEFVNQSQVWGEGSGVSAGQLPHPRVMDGPGSIHVHPTGTGVCVPSERIRFQRCRGRAGTVCLSSAHHGLWVTPL